MACSDSDAREIPDTPSTSASSPTLVDASALSSQIELSAEADRFPAEYVSKSGMGSHEDEYTETKARSRHNVLGEEELSQVSPTLLPSNNVGSGYPSLSRPLSNPSFRKRRPHRERVLLPLSRHYLRRIGCRFQL
eukprot:306430_1